MSFSSEKHLLLISNLIFLSTMLIFHGIGKCHNDYIISEYLSQEYFYLFWTSVFREIIRKKYFRKFVHISIIYPQNVINLWISNLKNAENLILRTILFSKIMLWNLYITIHKLSTMMWITLLNFIFFHVLLINLSTFFTHNFIKYVDIIFLNPVSFFVFTKIFHTILSKIFDFFAYLVYY